MPSTMTHPTITPEPMARLEHSVQKPDHLTIATARTCDSTRIIEPKEVDKDEQAQSQRDRNAQNTDAARCRSRDSPHAGRGLDDGVSRATPGMTGKHTNAMRDGSSA